jgi:hypothetical protein
MSFVSQEQMDRSKNRQRFDGDNLYEIGGTVALVGLGILPEGLSMADEEQARREAKETWLGYAAYKGAKTVGGVAVVGYCVGFLTYEGVSSLWK